MPDSVRTRNGVHARTGSPHTRHRGSIRANISPPRKQTDYPDRDIDCQAAIDLAFQQLIADAAKQGWEATEVAMAIMEVAADFVGASEDSLDDEVAFEPLDLEHKD